MEIVFLESALQLLDEYTPEFMSVKAFNEFYENIQL